MKQYFWKDWKRVTKLEKEAIESLKKGKEIILEEIPKREIVSIYAQGSLVRREMNPKSDVDLMVITKNTRFNNRIEKKGLEIEKDYKPKLNICAYSLNELKTGRRAKSILKTGKPHPIKIASLLDSYKLIYGGPINKRTLKMRDPREDLRGMINSFKEDIFPWYNKKIVDFDFLIKQVFWLTFDEERVNERNPPIEWGKLASSIKDKQHVIHSAWKYRLKPTKSLKLKKEFLLGLKKHLRNLEKELK